MQTVPSVNVHAGREWYNGRNNGSYVKNSSTLGNCRGRQRAHLRTCVATKTKTTRPKSSSISSQIPQPTRVVVPRSHSPPPNKERWVPPPGKATKGQKLSWQSSKARLEINPTVDNIVKDDVDDEGSLDSEDHQQHSAKHVSMEHNERLFDEIEAYEMRIQGLIEGIGMLKERARLHGNREQADHLRLEINAQLRALEQVQNALFRSVPDACLLRNERSPSPIRSNQRSSSPRYVTQRSVSAEEQRSRRLSPKVSFRDDPIQDKRRARSTTPVRGPLHLNPDRERLLKSLSESEADIAQITKQLSFVKDILTKLKLDNQPVSLEVEKLNQQRNQLLRLIEQFEKSNDRLGNFIRHHYHLEAEDGIFNDKDDTLLTRVQELQNENAEIRRLLVEREKDNVNLQSELERVRTHAIGFDTMKTSLENNRAHLQRELYAKEGEINRLQCLLKSLERDLQRSRFQCDNLKRTIQRTPMFPHSSCATPPSVVAKTHGLTVEKLQVQLLDRDRHIEELEKKLFENTSDPLMEANSEIARLRSKLDHSERLITEFKEQLHAQALKSSVDNSKVHVSEVELDKMRVRLQKRIEELEPLPELLRQAEMRNHDLQSRIMEQERRLVDQTRYIDGLKANRHVQADMIDRMKEHTLDENNRTLQQKIDALQRQVVALEEDNASLLRNLNAKDEALRNAQSRLNAKSYELTNLSKQINTTQTDLKVQEDTYGSKERFFQQRISELEQYISKVRLDCTQLKREKEECERRYTSQLGELRDKLEQSNNNNRSMQNYVNSLKTTYASVFNDNLPPPFATAPFPRYPATPSTYP